MEETEEWRGDWYLPSSPDNRVPGILRFAPDEGIHLELLGSFQDDPIGSSNLKNELLILGECEPPKDVSLHGCVQVAAGAPFARSRWARYACNRVFENVHFESEEEMVFDSLHLRIHSLDEWADLGGFTIENDFLEKSSTIGHKKPVAKGLASGEGWDLKLAASAKGPSTNYAQTTASIEQKTWFIVNWSDSQPLEEVWAWIARLSGLMGLALMEHGYVTEVQLRCEAAREQLAGGNSYLHPVVFHYNRTGQQLPKKPRLPFEMLFTFGEQPERTAEVVQRWMERWPLLRPVLDQFFGTRRNITMFVNQRFLDATQALEAYHRRTIIPSSEEVSNHKAKVGRILSSVSTQDAEWLKDRLRYSIEPGLRKRLQYLVRLVEEFIPGLEKNWKSFINTVVSTRNYYTHYDSRLEHAAMTGIHELHLASEKLLLIMTLLLLLDLGYSRAEVHKLLEDSYRFQSTTEWLMRSETLID